MLVNAIPAYHLQSNQRAACVHGTSEKVGGAIAKWSVIRGYDRGIMNDAYQMQVTFLGLQLSHLHHHHFWRICMYIG